MTDPTDFRALCAELAEALERHDLTLADDKLLDRAATAYRASFRTALAAPQQGAPSDDELWDLSAPFWDWDGERRFFGSTAFARAVLARYSHPAPVPVAERQAALAALDHILKHSTTNLGEATIRRVLEPQL